VVCHHAGAFPHISILIERGEHRGLVRAGLQQVHRRGRGAEGGASSASPSSCSACASPSRALAGAALQARLCSRGGGQAKLVSLLSHAQLQRQLQQCPQAAVGAAEAC
jgi:hypothetical protein